MEITPRETILKRVRQSVMEKTKNTFADLDLDSPVLKSIDDDPVVQFADAFTGIGGEFIYCGNKFDMNDKLISLIEYKNWTKLFATERALQEQLQEVGIEYIHDYHDGDYTECVITGCEALISRSGTVLVSSKKQNRTLISLAQAHVVIAYTSQLARDIREGFVFLRNQYGKELPSWTGLITGPSRTADIERTRVTGVHGAKEIYIFLVENRNQNHF